MQVCNVRMVPMSTQASSQELEDMIESMIDKMEPEYEPTQVTGKIKHLEITGEHKEKRSHVINPVTDWEMPWVRILG